MARQRLQLGNAITIVVGGRVRRGNVMEWLPHARFRWKGYSGTYGELMLADEGGSWIRGHHEPDTIQIRALLAANALGVDR